MLAHPSWCDQASFDLRCWCEGWFGQESKGGRLLSGFGVVSIGLRDQGGDEGAEECFTAAAGVVYELEEAEIGGQLLLRDAAMRP